MGSEEIDPSKNTDEARQRAVKYLKNYLDEIDECKKLEDFFILVLSVMIYSELVQAHFIDSMDDNGQEQLASLKDMADQIKNDVVAGYHKQVNQKLN